MATTIEKKPRRRCRPSGQKAGVRGKSGKITGLPESAAFTVCGGQDFVLLPVSDLAEWLEDQLDYAESVAVLAKERKQAIPIEQAIVELSGRANRKAK